MRILYLLMLLLLQGCVTLPSVDTISYGDRVGMPLGIQAQENYIETHSQSYWFRWSLPIGRRKHVD